MSQSIMLAIPPRELHSIDIQRKFKIDNNSIVNENNKKIYKNLPIKNMSYY